jgi:hypothetical protein
MSRIRYRQLEVLEYIYYSPSRYLRPLLYYSEFFERFYSSPRFYVYSTIWYGSAYYALSPTMKVLPRYSFQITTQIFENCYVWSLASNKAKSDWTFVEILSCEKIDHIINDSILGFFGSLTQLISDCYNDWKVWRSIKFTYKHIDYSTKSDLPLNWYHFSCLRLTYCCECDASCCVEKHKLQPSGFVVLKTILIARDRENSFSMYMWVKVVELLET